MAAKAHAAKVRERKKWIELDYGPRPVIREGAMRKLKPYEILRLEMAKRAYLFKRDRAAHAQRCAMLPLSMIVR